MNGGPKFLQVRMSLSPTQICKCAHNNAKIGSYYDKRKPRCYIHASPQDFFFGNPQKQGLGQKICNRQEI